VHPQLHTPRVIPFRTAPKGRAESAYSLPKDRCDCQRSRPFRTGAPRGARHRTDKEQPRIAAERKNSCPRAQDLGFAAARPFTSETRDNTQGYHRPDWKEQPLRCGRPDLVPEGASFKVSPELPERNHLATETEDGAFRLQLQDPSPGSSGKEPPFGGSPEMVQPNRTSRPGEPNLSGRKHPFRGSLKWCLAAPTSSPGGPCPSSRTASPWKPKWWPVPPSQASRMRPLKTAPSRGGSAI
jgi:hypothetical protein